MTKHPDLVPAILVMCESAAAHGTTIRVGMDVVSIAWFARQLSAGEDTAFLRTAFTPAERAYCSGHAERFAVRWAAKEAVAKAIGTGFRGLHPSHIEILHQPDGRAEVATAGASTWPHEAHVWAWALTLCHEGDAALAVAVATTPTTTLARSNPNIREIPAAIQSQTGQAS